MTRRLEWQYKTKIIDLFFPTKKLSISESHSLLDFTATTKNSFSFKKVICSWSIHPLLSKTWSQSVFMIRFIASWLQPVFTVDRSLTARWCWDWLVLCMRSFGQVCTFIHTRCKRSCQKRPKSLEQKKVNTANDRFSSSPLFDESSHWNRSWLGAISYLLITPEVSLWLKDQQKHH